MPSVTLTYSAADATRIAIALGALIHFPPAPGQEVVPATAAEAKDWLGKQVIRLVREYEHNKAMQELQPPVSPVIT